MNFVRQVQPVPFVLAVVIAGCGQSATDSPADSAVQDQSFEAPATAEQPGPGEPSLVASSDRGQISSPVVQAAGAADSEQAKQDPDDRIAVIGGETAATAIAEPAPVYEGKGIFAWDTGGSSSQPYEPADIEQRDGWTGIRRGDKPDSFQGDAVMCNEQIFAVFRKTAGMIDVFANTPSGAVPRVKLQLLGPEGGQAEKLENAAIVENTRGAIRIDARYLTAQGDSLTATFRLQRGNPLLETEPGAGAGQLRIECPGEFVVLPDFFADDIVIDPRKLNMAVAEVPSENFLMHLTGNGDAIAACVFENRDQDVKVLLSGNAGERTIAGSEIAFGEQKKIWLALMEAPQIWHALDIQPADAEEIMTLNWTMPFTAQWRVDFTQKANELTDSWEMLLQEEGKDDFLKPSWLGGEEKRIGPTRRRWTTVLDHFPYPAWSDSSGQGFLQPLQHRALTFEGPTVIYPINRVEQTPTEAYTVVDILRNSLGVGPCEYILQVESHKQELTGRATCSARNDLEKIYKANQQKAKREEVEEALDDALAFVTHIRSRISHYVEFGHEIREYLAEQKEAHPELAEPLDQLDSIAAIIDQSLERRRDEIKTPEHVARMNEGFRGTLLNASGPSALKKLKRYTTTLTTIGGGQDELVGECRWVVRALRQKAGLLMATNPECAEIAKEVRARTQEALMNPAQYEAARH